MILDTSFLIHLGEEEENAFQKALELKKRGVKQQVALPTVFELYYGAAYTNSDEEYRKVQNLLLMYPIVELDKEISEKAAELLAKADRKEGGESGVDNEDALIGAVAFDLDEAVLTDNITDFSKLGVKIEPY